MAECEKVIKNLQKNSFVDKNMDFNLSQHYIA